MNYSFISWQLFLPATGNTAYIGAPQQEGQAQHFKQTGASGPPGVLPQPNVPLSCGYKSSCLVGQVVFFLGFSGGEVEIQ